MLLKKEDKNTVIEILKNYMEVNKITIYQLEKNKILTWKTYNKMLKDTDSTITLKTLKRLISRLKFSKEERETLKSVVENYKMKPNKLISEDQSMIFTNKDLEEKIEEIKTLIEKNSIYNLKILEPTTLREENEYFQKRKIGSFDSDLETRTLLIKRMWDFNDTVSEKWKEFNLLLGINSKKDSVKMKKGLLTIAENLKEIALKLENAAFDSSELDKEDIIVIKEE
ncbi:hypothetical protein [Fusobacterium ulcerans]|uniref:Uncharacterized protein n=1 Tax=Fusobacterium ulcerans 12-1B TaxID=457404 RepID=H1PVP0_9FUSO|nr:hypothetical protein [Fusobacterium ulcerans]EHO79744.1 hypothetical protein HMPREF0402_02483 [Fusobacterium ulcerans 12-1B]